jgi:hypothetical protein
MRILVFSLILLFCSCSTQSKESMQKEYDSIVKVQMYYKETIEAALEPVAKGRNLNAAAEATRQIDSLNILSERLEKRKKELAESLFK